MRPLPFVGKEPREAPVLSLGLLDDDMNVLGLLPKLSYKRVGDIAHKVRLLRPGRASGDLGVYVRHQTLALGLVRGSTEPTTSDANDRAKRRR